MLGSFLQKAGPLTRAFLIAGFLVLGTKVGSAAHPIQTPGAEVLELSEPRPAAAASEISSYRSPLVPPAEQTQNRFTTLLPHGVCILWDKSLLVLHVLSDSLIAFSYFSIPLIPKVLALPSPAQLADANPIRNCRTRSPNAGAPNKDGERTRSQSYGCRPRAADD
jgi:hypothetical protein